MIRARLACAVAFMMLVPVACGVAEAGVGVATPEGQGAEQPRNVDSFDIPDELPGYAVVDMLTPEDTSCLDRPQVWLRALDPRTEGDWAADSDDTAHTLDQLQSLLGVFHYVMVGSQLTDEEVVEGNQRRIEEEREVGCRTIRFGGPLTLQTEGQEEAARTGMLMRRPHL